MNTHRLHYRERVYDEMCWTSCSCLEISILKCVHEKNLTASWTVMVHVEPWTASEGHVLSRHHFTLEKNTRSRWTILAIQRLSSPA